MTTVWILVLMLKVSSGSAFVTAPYNDSGSCHVAMLQANKQPNVLGANCTFVEIVGP